MGADDVLLGVLSLLLGALTAWFGLRGKKAEVEASKEATLHADEVEFRKSLLARIEQLERHDQAKSARIRELEHENKNLRIKVATLEAKVMRYEDRT